MRGLDRFWIHTVQVRPLVDEGAEGDSLGPAVAVSGFVDDSTKLVRGATGDEVVAAATVFLPAGAPDVPLGSEVTLPASLGSRVLTVVSVARHDSGPLGLPDHVELGVA